MRTFEWFSLQIALSKLSFNTLEIREWAFDCRKSIMIPTKLWIGMWKSNCPSVAVALVLDIIRKSSKVEKKVRALTIPLFHYQNFSSKIRMLWAVDRVVFVIWCKAYNPTMLYTIAFTVYTQNLVMRGSGDS